MSKEEDSKHDGFQLERHPRKKHKALCNGCEEDHRDQNSPQGLNKTKLTFGTEAPENMDHMWGTQKVALLEASGQTPRAFRCFPFVLPASNKTCADRRIAGHSGNNHLTAVLVYGTSHPSSGQKPSYHGIDQEFLNLGS